MSEFELSENEWETSSGLPLADIDAEIIGFVFGFNANIGTALCANITFQPLEGGGDPIEQSFSVGQGWETDGEGRLVTEDGRKRKINGNTNFGRLLTSAVTAVQATGEEMPFSSPRIPSEWMGTRWHIGTVQVPTKNPTTGVEKIKDAFVFTAYHGSESPAVESAPAAAGKSSSAGSKAKGGGKPAAGGLSDELVAKLTALAKEHDDHDAFVDAAYDVEGVNGDRAAEKAILASGSGSLYATAREG